MIQCFELWHWSKFKDQYHVSETYNSNVKNASECFYNHLWFLDGVNIYLVL